MPGFLYTVEQLKNALKVNGAKADKFTIRFSTPAADSKLTLKTEDMILCKSTSFPDKQIGEMVAWVQGRKLTLPGDTEFTAEWTLEFYNTTDHKLRKMFIDWMDQMDNYETNSHTCNPSTFMVDADVMQLDCKGGIAAGYTFHNMFPSHVEQIDVSGETINTIQVFRVSFRFSHWTTLAITA
jgi:hypothetical protein